MLTLLDTYNYSAILSMLYFANYSVTFILLFLTIHSCLNADSSVHSLMFFLKYSKKRYLPFVFAFIALVGVPPFSMFAPKFSAFSNAWAFGGPFFFSLSLLSVFLSFALYLQVFDVMFKPKLGGEGAIRQVKLSNNRNSSAVSFDTSKLTVLLCVFCSLGFLLFKDSFFLANVLL